MIIEVAEPWPGEHVYVLIDASGAVVAELGTLERALERAADVLGGPVQAVQQDHEYRVRRVCTWRERSYQLSAMIAAMEEG